MAPKRNVKISEPEKVVGALPEKPPRGRPKKMQPFEASSPITISIPVNKAGLVVPDAEKKVDTNTKIALANEVARSQILKEPIAARVIPPTPKRTRGRKKEVVSEFFNTSAVKEEPVEETVPSSDLVPTDSTVVKKNNRKTPVKNTQATKGVTRKRVADSTVKKPRIKRQKITPKVVTTKEEKIPTEETVQGDSTKADLTDPAPPKVQSKVQKKNTSSENASDVNSNVFSSPAVSSQMKRLLRGTRTVQQKKIQTVVEANNTKASDLVAPAPKPDGNTSLGVDPPELSVTGTKSNAKRTRLSKPKTSCIKSSAKEVETVKVDTPVNSRKNSISSGSNLSWTRDISSTSTTTCFTVVSSDFVCFDKKMPVLKLVNIDSKVDNYKPKPLEDSTSDSSSSSSSDSESTSEEQSSVHYVGSNSPVKVNSLNLSSSSCKSVATANADTDYVKKDYSKDAENLMQALNNIELEFINWIHDADSITTDLDDIKDSLFNILSNEFCALTHCKNLQEILKTGESDLNNILKESKHTTEKSKGSNTLEPYTKKVNSRFKKKLECNTFERMRTRSNKCDGNTVVESNIVRSDTAKPNAYESITVKSKTVENELPKSNTVEVEPLKLDNRVKSDSNKNKIVEINPIYSNNVKDNPIISNSDDSNAAKINKIESNSTSNIYNSNIKINKIENIPVNAIKIKPVETSNRVENSTTNTNRVENNTDGSSRVEIRTEDELLKPSTSGFGSKIFNNSPTWRRSRVSESSNSSPNQDMDVEHDDDDALSLFAESITGLESSRINTSIISAPVEKQLEEYIPKPVQKDFISPPNYSYCPTRITDQMKKSVIKIICEKQNADSTSIYKESNSETGSLPDSVESKQEIIEKTGPSHTEINIPKRKITLMADVYMIRPKESNIIFKGYCYHNIKNKCLAPIYSRPCRFSHVIPDPSVLVNKLSSLTNPVLIKEYMLIRRNDHVLVRYGTLFLFECVHRNLTRIVVEIAYDFITRHAKGIQISSTVKTAVVEVALLHLNNIDLGVCEDLLFLVVPNGSLLCEEFMQVMISTQNFSRFKSVFLSLTYFMVNNDRTFSLEVAEQILERVCILPFDEPLVRALIQIIRLTKQEIFLNSMIENFEKLISVNNDVMDQYLLIKSGVNFEKLARKVAEQRPVGQMVEQPMMVQPSMVQPSMVQPSMVQPSMVQPSMVQPSMVQPSVVQPSMVQPIEPRIGRPIFAPTLDPAMIVRPEMREGVPLPPSPDTTHLDNANKTAEDATPIITRTIRGSSFAPNAQTAVSPSSSNSEELTNTPNFNKWRHRSIFQHIHRPHYPHGQPMRPSFRMRPPFRMRHRGTGYANNHRLVTFGGSPTVYPSPGPDI